MWHDEVSHLTSWTKQSGGGRGNWKGEKRERRRRMREKLYLLSRFFCNRTVDSGRSKRQSWPTPRELCVGTKISWFHQALRGSGFLLLGLILI